MKSPFNFILPYILEYAIFPEYKIRDIKIIHLCFNRILEVYLTNFRCKERVLVAFKYFYNIEYVGDITCIRFRIPSHLHFICDIAEKCGIDGLPKDVYVNYFLFWDKKQEASTEKSVGAYLFIFQIVSLLVAFFWFLYLRLTIFQHHITIFQFYLIALQNFHNIFVLLYYLDTTRMYYEMEQTI